MHLQAPLSRMGFLSLLKWSGENQSDFRTRCISWLMQREPSYVGPWSTRAGFIEALALPEDGDEQKFSFALLITRNTSKNIQQVISSAIFM
jgi:hypothetical protein